MSENNSGAIDPQTGSTLSHHNPAGDTAFEHGKEGAHNRIDSKDERSVCISPALNVSRRLSFFL